MRDYPEPLALDDVIRDGVNSIYEVVRVTPSAVEGGLGHAWADELPSSPRAD